MVKKTRTKKVATTNRNPTKKNPPSNLSQEPTFTLNNLNNDDVIMSLSNAYENKRVRQVIEWERVQRKNLVRTV